MVMKESLASKSAMAAYVSHSTFFTRSPDEKSSIEHAVLLNHRFSERLRHVMAHSDGHASSCAASVPTDSTRLPNSAWRRSTRLRICASEAGRVLMTRQVS